MGSVGSNRVVRKIEKFGCAWSQSTPAGCGSYSHEVKVQPPSILTFQSIFTFSFLVWFQFLFLPFLLCFLETYMNHIALLWIWDLTRSCLHNRSYWRLRGFLLLGEWNRANWEISNSWERVWIYESSVFSPLGLVVQSVFHLAKVVTILNLFPVADCGFSWATYLHKNVLLCVLRIIK